MLALTEANFFDHLPNMTHEQIELAINDLVFDTALAILNQCRQRQVDEPDREVPEVESVAGLLLARRLRTYREQKSATTRATKAAAPKPAPAPSLDLTSLFK